MEELLLRDSVQPALTANKPAQAVHTEIGVPPSLMDKELERQLSEIPDKMAFKIGEVADMIDVKTYVLRYWETEFDAIRPKKSNSNQRMYTRRDVENVMLIKKLLYRDRFSIEGARKALKSLKGEVKEVKSWNSVSNKIERSTRELEDLIEMIELAKKSIGESL